MPPTQVTDALAATKFAPPRVPPGWVARPRLDAALERGVQAPLTLIAAPPGAGKSALLGSWVAARRCDGPLAWLSLEGLDRDRRRFWRGVLEALSRAGAPEPVASLTVHPTESVDLVVPELVNALEHVDEPIVLVLDDLHEVGDGAAIADLDRLLRHPPGALRIVAATRIDPPLRLGRMRLAGDLSDIRERDLAFTRGRDRRAARAPAEPSSSRPRCASSGSGPRAGRPGSGWPRSRCARILTRPGSWPPSRATTPRWPTTCSRRCSRSSRPSSSTSSCARRSSASSPASSPPR